MYNQNDIQEARRSLNRCCGLLVSVLLPLLAVYLMGILKGWQGMMLAVLLAGFACAVLVCDLKLLPVLRYVRFLEGMEKGLRRSMDCTLERLDTHVQMQDGIRVYALHVRLKADGDSRIFYVNASKVNCLPQMGAQVRLTGYGRHVVRCEVL